VLLGCGDEQDPVSALLEMNELWISQWRSLTEVCENAPSFTGASKMPILLSITLTLFSRMLHCALANTPYCQLLYTTASLNSMHDVLHSPRQANPCIVE